MIVYHLTHKENVSRYLNTGLSRTEKRFYVFNRWDLTEIILDALILDAINPESSYEDYRVLVLRVEEDILVPAPIPHSQLPSRITESGQSLLQDHSFYLETDLLPNRILAVKDVVGNPLDISEARAKKYHSIARFLSYAKPHAHHYLIATLAGIGKFLSPLVFPYILRLVLDEVIPARVMGFDNQISEINRLILILVCVNLFWMAACYLRSLFTAKAGHRMIRDLRVALFNHVQRLSHQFFAKRQTGAIVSRMVNDIAQAQNFVGSALTNVWMDSILLLVLLIVLFNLHATLTLIALALMPIFLLSIKTLGSRIRRASREVQQRVEVISGGLQEKIAGVTIVKGFTREPEESERFASQSDKLYNRVLRSVQYSALNEMLVGFVVLTAPGLVLWYGSRQILQGQLTVGELTQFLLYLTMFYGPIQRLSDLNVLLSNSLAAIERIFEYFDMQPQVIEKPNAKKLRQVVGTIEFDRVTFGYERGVPVLQNIDLTIEAGETVAFVGASGSGKSTLANLVPRFYDPDEGAVRLDGHDLRDIRLADLRAVIGIVNQETILFSGTIQENLLLAKPNATPSELKEALIAANAWEFVSALPEGLWTEISERGGNLSGGQKQRLAIARAFLKDPRILILDEATSALDSKSEHQIQDALSRLLQERSSIVIAHRLSTVMNADKIVVLERGKIIEIGAHQALLQKGGVYAQLYQEQFFHLTP
ncbi:MAG TPA: ABC transporter ATP-binding protein [bacterium]|nr:ABC transporter ATP-binding protein [bacterium]